MDAKEKDLIVWNIEKTDSILQSIKKIEERITKIETIQEIILKLANEEAPETGTSNNILNSVLSIVEKNPAIQDRALTLAETIMGIKK